MATRSIATTVSPRVDVEKAARASLDLAALDGLQRVRINGTELAYLEQGTGEPVIFVHGAIIDLTMWQEQVPAFGKQYRAIAYSRRYHWPNEGIPDGADDPMLPHADDLAEVIRTLQLAPAHLVGHSAGALICMYVALRNPELVHTLTLIEQPFLTSTSLPPKPRELLQLFLTHPRLGKAWMEFGVNFDPCLAAFKRGEVEEGIRVFLNFINPLESNFYEGLPADARRHLLANSNTLKAEFFGKEGIPAFKDQNVRRIKHPTLLVVGEKSPGPIRRLSDRLGELLPNTERVEIPGVSHTMQWQNPAALNRAVLDFLDRHAA